MKEKHSKSHKTTKIIVGVIIVIAIAVVAVCGIRFMNNKQTINRATKSLDIFIDKYYAPSENEKGGLIAGAHFWTRAEMYEIVVDAYEKTGDEKYRDLMEQLYYGFIDSFGEDWAHNEYNDDIMWMTIGCARSYQLTGEEMYKETAEHHFNLVFDRGWSEDLGGGIFWRTDNQCKNSCINCPATIAACLLYQITGNEDYLTKALQIYQWQIDTLYQENGAVYDNINMKGECNTWCSTYNQGTFIGASHLLYKITGEQIYLDRAAKAADYTMNDMFQQGVINTEDSGNDLPGFKGILARWLGKLAQEEGMEKYGDWLKLNAESAWNNRNEDGLMNTLWAEKTKDSFQMPWGCSAAISLLFSVIGL